MPWPRWWVTVEPSADSLAKVSTPSPVKAPTCMRVRLHVGESAAYLRYAKFSGFGHIPCGNPVGNGPLGLDTAFLGLGLYVPVGYPMGDGDDIALAVYATPDPTPTSGEEGGVDCPDMTLLRAPMLELAIVDGTAWRCRTRSDAIAYPGEDPDPTPIEQYSGAVLKGQWTLFTLKRIGAIDGTGVLELRRADGTGAYTTVVSYSGATAYNGTYPGFVQVGIQRSAPATAERELFVDELKVAGANGSHALVDPRGTPIGSGGGGGPGGDDPVPPPDPGSEVSGFGMWALPTGDPGPWNFTLKNVGPSSAKSLFASARAAGMKLAVQAAGEPGGLGGWNEGKQWHEDRYLARLEAMADDPYLADAIADGTAPCGHLPDEPLEHISEYGGAIPVPSLRRIVAKYVELWPGWPILITCPKPRIEYDIPGVTHLQFAYRLPQGNVNAGLASAMSMATSIGKRLLVGPNVIDFDGKFGQNIFCTPAQYRACGAVLAACPIADFMASWQFRKEWYAQNDGSGTMAAAVLAVRAIWRANHP